MPVVTDNVEILHRAQMGQDVYIYGIRTYQTYIYTYIYIHIYIYTYIYIHIDNFPFSPQGSSASLSSPLSSPCYVGSHCSAFLSVLSLEQQCQWLQTMWKYCIAHKRGRMYIYTEYARTKHIYIHIYTYIYIYI